jgi:hypothetical protein
MKKHVGFILLAFMTAIFFLSCEKKVDIDKEKEAIKAVFDAEKDAFFSRNPVAMADCWAHESTSAKLYMGAKGQRLFESFDSVKVHDESITKDDSWDRSQVKVTFTNYQIDVMEESAWVLCDAHWDGIFRGDTINMVQTRISVLKKIEGNWKFALIAIYNVPEK